MSVLFFSVSSFAGITPKEDSINKFLWKLNSHQSTKELEFIFECENPNDKNAILILRASDNCLVCKDCEDKIVNFMGPSFIVISWGWKEAFGSYRMNIFNMWNDLVYFINRYGKLIKVPDGPPDNIQIA